jgi:tetrahydromethanopterin S-methyltransferase subunit G
MNNQNFFDYETRELLNKIEEETKFILGKEYEKISKKIEEDKKKLSFLIN